MPQLSPPTVANPGFTGSVTTVWAVPPPWILLMDQVQEVVAPARLAGVKRIVEATNSRTAAIITRVWVVVDTASPRSRASDQAMTSISGDAGCRLKTAPQTSNGGKTD